MMTHSGWCRISQTPGLDITTFCDCHVKQIVVFESALTALQQRVEAAEREMITGDSLTLPKMDGQEVTPGILIIGEPYPVPGTNTLRALANVRGMLCVVELSLKFGKRNAAQEKVRK